MDEQVRNLFKTFSFVKNADFPLFRGKLPPEIFAEIEKFVAIANSVQKNRLYFLRDHKNVGKNSFQMSVPATELERSFSLPYLIYLGQLFVEKVEGLKPEEIDRKIVLRTHLGHIDTTDFWINFTREGDYSPLHKHSGTISGVIYFRNDDKIPVEFENGLKIVGKPGEILVFPSQSRHGVPKNTGKSERISLAFNLIWVGSRRLRYLTSFRPTDHGIEPLANMWPGEQKPLAPEIAQLLEHHLGKNPPKSSRKRERNKSL